MNHRRARHRPRPQRERGAAAVEFIVVALVLLLPFLTLLQAGIQLHAQRIASAAAREGAETTAQWQGTEANGRTTARQYVDRLGQVIVTGATVTTQRGPEESQATVSIRIVTVAPWLGDSVEATATAPTERFVE